jgi:hypothetical protein
MQIANSNNVVVSPDINANDDYIGFSEANFSWTPGELSGRITPSQRNFQLRLEGDLHFPEGKISLIVGPTGSGKTSVLHALLGEMHFRPSGPQSSFNLPRKYGVAYAAQESWVLNETVKVCLFS